MPHDVDTRGACMASITHCCLHGQTLLATGNAAVDTAVRNQTVQASDDFTAGAAGPLRTSEPLVLQA
eukprot:15430637-Alexandrium_andersonii.AAC.1